MDMNIIFDQLFILSILLTASNVKTVNLIPGWDKFQQIIAKNKQTLLSEDLATTTPGSSTNDGFKSVLRNSEYSYLDSSTDVVIGFSFMHKIDEFKNDIPTLNLYIVTPQHKIQGRFGESQKKGKSQLEINFLKAKSEALGNKLVRKPQKNSIRGESNMKTYLNMGQNQDENTGNNIKDRNVSEVKLLTAFFHNVHLRTYNELNKIAHYEPSPIIKKKLSLLAKEYQQVFESHLDDTKKTSIRSQHGEKIILRSTVDTAARYMRKMLDIAILETDDVTSKNYLNNTVRTKFDHIIKQEYERICTKFHVCRRVENKTFIDLMVEMLNVLSALPVEKMKKAVVGIYKYFAANEFLEILDKDLHERLKLAVDLFESNTPEEIAMIFTMFSNTVKNRHVPIDQSETYGDMQKNLINKTLVIRDWLELLENAATVSPENLKQWSVHMEELQDWIRDETGDIELLMHEMCSFVVDQLLTHVDDATKKEIRKQTRVLFDTAAFRVGR